MNGEDFCRVLLERSSRPLRPTRPALARSRSRSLVHSLARSLARSPARAQAPQPLAENPYDDTMSGVPTTEKCLLPRVVMRCPLLRVREGFPYAAERRRRGCDGRSGDAKASVRPLGESRQSRGATMPSRRRLARRFAAVDRWSWFPPLLVIPLEPGGSKWNVATYRSEH